MVITVLIDDKNVEIDLTSFEEELGEKYPDRSVPRDEFSVKVE